MKKMGKSGRKGLFGGMPQLPPGMMTR
jgi:hypothetical protein